MMPGEPFLSVVMAGYNADQYIQRAVESILGQTYRHFELIIIDDGSTDRSWEILRNFQDSRIRLIRNDHNLGQTCSLNKGLALARGEIIVRHDADDYSNTDRFRVQVDFLRNHPDVGLLGASYYFVDDQDELLDIVYLPETNAELQARLLEGNIFCHGSVMIRTDIIRKVGGYNEAFRVTQDYDLWLRLAEHCKLANIQQPLYYFRFDGETITRKNRPTQLAFRRLARDLAQQRRSWGKEDPIPEDVLSIYAPEPERLAGDARWASYLFYASGQKEKATSFLTQSLQYQPNRRVGPDMSEWAISRAHALRKVKGDLRAGEAFLNWVYEVLPSERMAFSKRKILGRYYAESIFLSHQDSCKTPVFSSYFRAVLSDPNWLSNRGLLKSVMQNSRTFPVFIIILYVSLLGFASVFVSTRYGIGISPDSVSYINGARNLEQGYGFVMTTLDGPGSPITHYSPFYPLILSLFGRVGVDPLAGARWLGSAFFAINILLISSMLLAILYQSKNHLSWTAVVVALFALSSMTMLEIHTMAWTEPTFILLSLLGFILLSVYFGNQNVLYLILSAVVIGLAFLTRYAGIALIITGFIGILLLGNKPVRTRFLHSLVYGVIGALPGAVWMVRNVVYTGTATNREITFQSFDRNHIMELITTLSSWLLIPEDLGAWGKVGMIFVVFLFIFAAYGLVFFKSKPKRPYSTELRPIPKLIQALILYIPIYFMTLIATNTFLDTYTPFDRRILSPVYVAGLIVVYYMVAELANALHRHWAYLAVILISGGYLVISGINAYEYVSTSYRSGLGFNQLYWHQSRTLEALRSLQPGIPIYSNANEAIYIHTGEPAYPIPRQMRSYLQIENQKYEEQKEVMKDHLYNKGGVLVYFSETRNVNLPINNLIKEFNLHQIISADDGAIYSVGSAP
jgi:glycosyltransferase involved in cell wall biosynthesis